MSWSPPLFPTLCWSLVFHVCWLLLKENNYFFTRVWYFWMWCHQKSMIHLFLMPAGQPLSRWVWVMFSSKIGIMQAEIIIIIIRLKFLDIIIYTLQIKKKKYFFKHSIHEYACKKKGNRIILWSTRWCTVELRFNEGPRDWQNLFAKNGFLISRFFFIHIISLFIGVK